MVADDPIIKPPRKSIDFNRSPDSLYDLGEALETFGRLLKDNNTTIRDLAIAADRCKLSLAWRLDQK